MIAFLTCWFSTLVSEAVISPRLCNFSCAITFSRGKKSLLSELLRQLQHACESPKLVQNHRGPAHQRRRDLPVGRQATRTSRSAHSLRSILYRFRFGASTDLGRTNSTGDLPIVDVDAAAGGILSQQVSARLQNLYKRAREDVGNMEMAREFRRARERDLPEQRNQYSFHLSNPKPEHTTGGSGRGARRGGGAGSGRTGC